MSKRLTTNKKSKNILAIVCKIYIGQLSLSISLLLGLSIRALTDPQIHKIVLSMTRFIDDGFQHSLQKLDYIQLP